MAEPAPPQRKRRSRTTPKSVARAETTAKALIYAGGFGTIIAIALIFVFLVAMVVPLFTGSDAADSRAVASRIDAEPPLGIGCDEYRAIAWSLARDGTVRLLDYANGSELGERALYEGPRPTAVASTNSNVDWLFGFEDGTVRYLSIRFAVSYLEPSDLTADERRLAVGERAHHDDGIIERTPENQYRLVVFVPAVGEPIQVGKSAIHALDLSFPPSGKAFAALTRDKVLTVATIQKRLDMMTGVEREVARKLVLPYEVPDGRELPPHVALTGGATELFLVWADGFCIRYDSRRLGDDGNPVPDDRRRTEMLRLIDDGGEVRSLGFLVGKSTLLVGDNAGQLHAWFPTRPQAATTLDGIEMVRPRIYRGPRSAVRCLATSRRSRLLMVGYESGEARVFQATQDNILARLDAQRTSPADAVALAPKEDALLVSSASGWRAWDFDAGHHDVSFSTLFRPIWYERDDEPSHTWQSTGSDDSEPKLGLIPLIFGTLKATLYSMLMAIPIALLAAVYTSEFLKPSVRAPVKSVIEMMASLPSVVLGFLAALVVAPFVANVLPATLAALLTVPFAFVLGARLWQMLPSHTALRLGGAPKLFVMGCCLPIGIGMAVVVGPWMESGFFGGDIAAWLNREEGVGGAMGGWSFLLLPLGVLILAVFWGRLGAPYIRSVGFDWTRGQSAMFDLIRFTAMIGIGFLIALGIGSLLSMVGLDPRNSFMGHYAPRNAMIVGFAMGFAIVPIIYTLAEDALSAVPSALREGSLGAGATPWQTAVRIVIPTAMSGIFGAIMVGLGRAVGETMIVLMAAGNTPIMEWDPFSGFRALSANIATELPEAPQGSSHYRVLFLSGLVLFLMTFVINSGAEWIRKRFRARYAEQL